MSEIPVIAPREIPDDEVIVDVREQNEWDAGHAPGAVHIPLGELPGRVAELADIEEPWQIVCRSGNRSGRAVQWLEQQGYQAVNVEGGMKQWAAEGKAMTSDQGEPQVI
ncbi:MAG: rhodanese-like domain-containing protein [Micrococcales bacterium]|nr:rhodanese-like domain-containing protein [Micrococcales bacterium]